MATDSRRSFSQLAVLVSGDRVRLARESMGWSQTELSAQMTGAITSAAISQLEAGKNGTTGPTLERLCTALGYPPTFFTLRERDTSVPGYFRSLRAAPAKARRQALSQAHLLRDLTIALEKHAKLPTLDVPRVPLDTDDLNDVEDIADTVRHRWNLGDAPVANVVREIERHGIVTARVAVDRHEIDAFSVPFPDRPVVVLGTDKQVTARSRFDAAHELGHLVMHEWEDADTKPAEQQAHRFAAALLMPRDPIIDLLPRRVDWGSLTELKATWGVSIAALLFRSKTLGVMPEHIYLNAVKAMSSRGWRVTEPGDHLLGRPEQPVLLNRAVTVLSQEGITLERLADEAALPIELIRRLLGIQDARTIIDI